MMILSIQQEDSHWRVVCYEFNFWIKGWYLHIDSSSSGAPRALKRMKGNIFNYLHRFTWFGLQLLEQFNFCWLVIMRYRTLLTALCLGVMHGPRGELFIAHGTLYIGIFYTAFSVFVFICVFYHYITMCRSPLCPVLSCYYHPYPLCHFWGHNLLYKKIKADEDKISDIIIGCTSADLSSLKAED